MAPKLIAILAAAALGAAACGKDERKFAQPASGGSTAPAQSEATTPQANTSTTPANIGQPQSMAEKREGANPVQQQIDPKEREQRRDFQQKGDQAGPRSAETAPSN
jgi:hypothetical protein